MKVFVVLCLFVFVGCSGLGLQKRMTVVPDEFSMTTETTPNKFDQWNPSKVTVNLKWKIEKPKKEEPKP